MGFFSWVTSDTNESISNQFSNVGALPVYLVTPNNEYIYEDNYEGYGEFGGQDAYALLARWNKPELCTGIDDEDRNIGIDLFFGDDEYEFKLKFSTSKDLKYENLNPSQSCDCQGYFYSFEDEDYSDWEEDED